MKILELYVLCCLIFVACKKETTDVPFIIEGITIDNYPRIDGSTSASPLQTLIACKLLDIDYSWRQRLEYDNTWNIFPNYNDIPEEKQEAFRNCLFSSGTHGAYMNLINKEADFILTARKVSDDEKSHANNLGITLIETPIALDAFIFITNPSNPVNSLTTKQIQDIYTGKITRWNEVGGNYNKIKPYVRNVNSGSQELMESLVMRGLDMSDLPAEMESSMIGAFHAVRSDIDALCYTVYYYKEQMVREPIVNHIAIDGVYPAENTLRNRSYPYVTEVYMVIRGDLEQTSMAYKLYELLLSGAGKNVINESGYIAD